MDRFAPFHAKLHAHQLLWPFDVMVLGATGAGKSTTITRLGGQRIPPVGHGVGPQTQEVCSYKLDDSMRLHDTPGLGDSPRQDAKHMAKIRERLQETSLVDQHDYRLIDAAVLILDGSQRDIGAALQVLEQVLLPGLPSSRIMLAINQADLAMKGRYWDAHRNCPQAPLQAYLAEQANTLQHRLQHSTGANLPMPVSYSAATGWHMDALLQQWLHGMPLHRHAA